MDFKDQVRALGERVSQLKDSIHTEEATKNAFIMPFLQTLGYDVFNPLEVVPEFICDVGIKKGEKIDYAIFKDGAPVILVECKHWRQSLDVHDGQLLRYFHVSKAKFSILTNGLIFRFYTDLVDANKMDDKPFFEFNLEAIKDGQIEKLKEFHKSSFDVESVYQSAFESKNSNELRALLQKEFNDPGDEFAKHFVRQVYPSMITAKVLDYYKPLLKRTIANFINDTLNDRLKLAITTDEKLTIDGAPAEESAASPTIPGQPDKAEIITTEEELEGFYIVRAILRKHVPVSRITYRDALSYFAIFLDDNNRKPLCRLYLNGQSKKYIGTFDATKKETKAEIKSIDDIYAFSAELEAALTGYLTSKIKEEA